MASPGTELIWIHFLKFKLVFKKRAERNAGHRDVISCFRMLNIPWMVKNSYIQALTMANSQTFDYSHLGKTIRISSSVKRQNLEKGETEGRNYECKTISS